MVFCCVRAPKLRRSFGRAARTVRTFARDPETLSPFVLKLERFHLFGGSFRFAKTQNGPPSKPQKGLTSQMAPKAPKSPKTSLFHR